MKTVEFCYWLQGFFEMADPHTLDEKQTELIRRHLALAFKHEIDPSYPKDQVAELNTIHQGTANPGPIHAWGHSHDVLLRC